MSPVHDERPAVAVHVGSLTMHGPVVGAWKCVVGAVCAVRIEGTELDGGAAGSVVVARRAERPGSRKTAFLKAQWHHGI